MGAVYCTRTFKTDDIAEATKLAEAEIQESLYDHGHSYSGAFGMATGVQISEVGPFATIESANAWLMEKAEKWGPAIGVRVDQAGGIPEGICWHFGAWCSS